MDFINAIKFGWACLKHSWFRTLKNIRATAAIAVFVLYIIGTIIAYQWLGWRIIMDEIQLAIAYGIAPFVIVFIIIFVYQLLITPSKVVSEKDTEITNLNNKLTESQEHIYELSNPATGESYNKTAKIYYMGPVNKRVAIHLNMALLDHSIKLVNVKPYGSGEIKVLFNARDSKYADAVLKLSCGPNMPSDYYRVRANDEQSWFYEKQFTRIDIIGDDAISDVEVVVS